MNDVTENLLDILQANEPAELTDSTLAWLSDGIRVYAKGGISLEKALGLNGGTGGQKKATTQLREWQRDSYLIQAWYKVTNDQVSLRQRSELLNTALFRFITSRWRNIKRFDTPPDNLSEINRLLFFALKAEQPLPTTGRGLHALIMRILENHEGMNFQKPEF